MIEIEIQNFQSVDRVCFQIKGFTAFVGRSNIGKSAVVRALRCALTGAAGTDFVRHGPKCERRVRGLKKCKCQTSVRVTLPELTFLWEKGDAVNQYTVQRPGADPEVYSKIDRGTPDFLLPLFSPVKVGTRHELLQVSEQFKPIFLLDEGGNTVADVLSDVAHLDQINAAMGLVSKDRKSALATRKVREKDVLELEKSLGHYDGLDDVVVWAQAMEQSYKALEGAQTTVVRLDGYLTALWGLTVTLKALGAAIKPATPDAVPLSEKGTELHQLSRYFQEVHKRALVVRRLRGIEEVAAPDAVPLRDAATKLSQVEGWLGQLWKFKSGLERLKGLDRLEVPEAPAIQDLRERLVTLQGYFVKLSRLMVVQTELESELAKVVAEEQKIMETFGELGVCPVCSQSIEADHCLRLGGD